MKNGVSPTISHLDIRIPFSPLSHTQKAVGEMSYIHTGSKQVFPRHCHPGDQSHKRNKTGGVQKPQARLFMSFLSIFNPPSHNSLYLSNFMNTCILLVKCWRSRSLYCVLNFAPQCWRVAPGFIRIADPLQEVTPKAWRTCSHMGLMTSGPL